MSQQMVQIMIPEVNFHGRRLFCQLLPTDNPDALATVLSKLLIKWMASQPVKKMTRSDLKGAKIITPN